MKKKPIIGVDLEGRRIRVGRVCEGFIEAHTSAFISNDRDEKTILNEVLKVVEEVFNNDVIGIGVGVPGLVDFETGVVHHLHSIPGWKKTPLKNILQDRFNVQVYINNDANCFVTGEKYFGKGRNYKNIVGLVMGTGLGSGIMIDGKLTAGINCSAGEFGRLPYLDKSFEHYCSEKFFISEYDLTLDQLLEQALLGDAKALKIFSKFGSHLGNVIITIMNTVDPELVILGGPVTKAYKYFKNSMYNSIAKFEYKDAVVRLKIDVSEESKISVLGAAALFYDAQMSHSLQEMSQKVQRTEQALKESEKKYFNLFNQIMDPIFIFDKKTHLFLDCNEKVVQKIYGYSIQEIKKMTPFDLHPGEDYKKVSKTINIKNPEIPFSYTHVTKSGKRIDVEILSDEIYYEGHDAWISIVRDVSERRRAERKAQRQLLMASVVYEVGKSLSSQLELKSLYADIVKTIFEAFDFNNISLFILNEHKQILDQKAAAGTYKGFLEPSLYVKVGEGMIGKACKEKKIQLSQDTHLNPDFRKYKDELTRSEISIPLISGEKIIGVLDIQCDQVNAFDEFDVTAIETLSTQITAAIENARLYFQARQEIKTRKKAQKELLESNINLESAKRETDNILNNVEEGIFLLDSKLNIGAQYSKSLEKILRIEKIANRNFISLFRGRAQESVIVSIKEYFDLYLNSGIDDKLIEELNPLSEIELFTNGKSGHFKQLQYLSFNFKRINKNGNNGEDTQLIFTVIDITEQKLLAKKLKESEEQTKRQLEMLLSILHVDASLLKEFMESTEQEMVYINSVLKKSVLEADLYELLADLYRSLHLIKGNASLLDLKLFVDLAHACEDEIELVKNKKDINSKDFVSISVRIATLNNSYDEINRLIERISRFQTNFRPKRNYEKELFINSIGHLISSLSAGMGKQVHFKHDKFHVHKIPFEHRLLVKEILVQLVRNSISHGIETPEERKANNKPQQGVIEITSYFEKEYFCISFRDDGRGIQADKVKLKVLESGKIQPDRIERLTEQQIAELIFLQGVSTSDSVNTVSGRGVGMDIIKNNVEKHGGKIELEFAKNEFCNFVIKLPANRQN
ncbi:MAG: ROK family protein [Calditrichaceae bacterium]|nr:ROK family protein [Calditrichaceae bacterium]MBN2707651.1 ROK family protein [Calditrichaceae bacterium]RQV93180.1 MAG: ROK family protein [Calditrichota bacterium]